eukprot:evm.model.scf_89.8 EVM.evm.TU.scf_89.8   scf_89:32674-35731(-)
MADRGCLIVSDRGVVQTPGVAGPWRSPLRQEGNLAPVVALGKFDGMHIGHRALAQAAATIGGHPWLISFSGMSKILGWKERLPIVPVCEKAQVLASWAPVCGGLVPRMRYLPFQEIRWMTPEEFVRLLAEELGATGVVAGRNYRFGYKASGDANLLEKLGAHYGLKVEIVDLVRTDAEASQEEVSTTQVRKALQEGDMHRIARILGRAYRLVSRVDGGCLASSRSVPSPTFLNQPPAEGEYMVSVRMHSTGQTQTSGRTKAVAMGPLKLRASLSAHGMVLDMENLRDLEDAGVVRLTADF